MTKKNWISKKIEKIMKEGVRKNTHKAVSSKNPRRKVSVFQASAIAYDMYKRKGRKKTK